MTRTAQYLRRSPVENDRHHPTTASMAMRTDAATSHRGICSGPGSRSSILSAFLGQRLRTSERPARFWPRQSPGAGAWGRARGSAEGAFRSPVGCLPAAPNSPAPGSAPPPRCRTLSHPKTVCSRSASPTTPPRRPRCRPGDQPVCRAPGRATCRPRCRGPRPPLWRASSSSATTKDWSSRSRSPTPWPARNRAP